MKKYLLLVLLITLTFVLKSQKYEFSLDTIDMFTETAVKEVSLNAIDRNSQFKTGRPGLKFGINGEDLYIKFKMQGGSFLHIRKEDPLLFKLENKEIIEFFPIKTYMTTSSGEFAVSELQPFYNLTEDKLKKITEFKISQIRLYYNDTYITVYPTDKNQDKISSMAKTILNVIKNNNK